MVIRRRFQLGRLGYVGLALATVALPLYFIVNNRGIIPILAATGTGDVLFFSSLWWRFRWRRSLEAELRGSRGCMCPNCTYPFPEMVFPHTCTECGYEIKSRDALKRDWATAWTEDVAG